MEKERIRALISEFLLHSELYEFSIRLFLDKKKIIYDELLLEEIIEELAKTVDELYKH